MKQIHYLGGFHIRFLISLPLVVSAENPTAIIA
jgi:hypothetical protein